MGSDRRKVTGKYLGAPAQVDPSVPNIARIYDYYLGGRENFRADRDAAEFLEQLIPGAGTAARDIRAFRHRAVRFLSQQGIGQFLDIGSGMPGMPGVTATPETVSVLDSAQQVNPGARVAYVDYDPVVVSHGGALLAKPTEAVMVQADLRDPESLLAHPSIRGHLDFGQPVGLLLVSVLHYVEDDDDPAGIVAVLREALAPGSYLVLDHITHEHIDRQRVDSVLAAYNRASATMNPRAAKQIRGLFDGFELVEPGLVDPAAWRPESGEAPDRKVSIAFAGVALKT